MRVFSFYVQLLSKFEKHHLTYTNVAHAALTFTGKSAIIPTLFTLVKMRGATVFITTKVSSRVALGAFGFFMILSTIASATFGKPASMAAFVCSIVGWVGMLYSWGINHYLDPSSHRRKEGLREALIKDYWMVGRIFAVASWMIMVMYYYHTELGMLELSRHDLFIAQHHPLPVWMYTLVPAAIIGSLMLANIHGRRLMR